jgi:hypothetical protein
MIIIILALIKNSFNFNLREVKNFEIKIPKNTTTKEYPPYLKAG